MSLYVELRTFTAVQWPVLHPWIKFSISVASQVIRASQDTTHSTSAGDAADSSHRKQVYLAKILTGEA